MLVWSSSVMQASTKMEAVMPLAAVGYYLRSLTPYLHHHHKLVRAHQHVITKWHHKLVWGLWPDDERPSAFDHQYVQYHMCGPHPHLFKVSCSSCDASSAS